MRGFLCKWQIIRFSLYFFLFLDSLRYQWSQGVPPDQKDMSCSCFFLFFSLSPGSQCEDGISGVIPEKVWVRGVKHTGTMIAGCRRSGVVLPFFSCYWGVWWWPSFSYGRFHLVRFLFLLLWGRGFMVVCFPEWTFSWTCCFRFLGLWYLLACFRLVMHFE